VAEFGAPVGITVNATAYVNSLGSIARPKLDKIVALALVDTTKSAISKASSLIAKRTGLRVATVKSRMYYSRVAVGDYEANVKSSRRPIPLIEFPVSQTAKGVSTHAWGKPQIIQHAFIATMKSGHRGVYRRVGKARLPIRQLWGPTISKTFATKEVQAVVNDTMQARLQTSLSRRMAAASRGHSTPGVVPDTNKQKKRATRRQPALDHNIARMPSTRAQVMRQRRRAVKGTAHGHGYPRPRLLR
jgi:hypothetical protein